MATPIYQSSVNCHFSLGRYNVRKSYQLFTCCPPHSLSHLPWPPSLQVLLPSIKCLNPLAKMGLPSLIYLFIYFCYRNALNLL
uniref:Uncharacterized protein n=1 Tax=Anguilla anguilla TaxID=7936 RepID=A0A0E9WL71_ANGAN